MKWTSAHLSTWEVIFRTIENIHVIEEKQKVTEERNTAQAPRINNQTLFVWREPLHLYLLIILELILSACFHHFDAPFLLCCRFGNGVVIARKGSGHFQQSCYVLWFDMIRIT